MGGAGQPERTTGMVMCLWSVPYLGLKATGRAGTRVLRESRGRRGTQWEPWWRSLEGGGGS